MTDFLLLADGSSLVLRADSGGGRILLAGGTNTDFVALSTRPRDVALAAEKRLRTGEAHTKAEGFLLKVDGTSYLLQTDASSKLSLQAGFTPYVTKARPRKKLLTSDTRN